MVVGGVEASTRDLHAQLPQAATQTYPLAIAMWEFSWLERKWAGAGYEDLDQALGELVERGYDSIRIDAFPHLIYHDPEATYTLVPHWQVQEWGSPGIIDVQVQPNLNAFLAKCKEYNIRVGLSSWFREDKEDLRMRLTTPEKLGEAWLATLRSIDAAGLLNTVLYVDLCNEWTGPFWCPFFENDPPEAIWSEWQTDKSKDWMRRSIKILKAAYPEIPYTFSFTGEMHDHLHDKGRFDMLDFLEPHIWMTQYNNNEFYEEVEWEWDRFVFDSFQRLALKGEPAFRAREAYWVNGLKGMIDHAARWSRDLGQALVTTECWGIVDYRDWPGLDWGYVKELCALGTEEAAQTGRWLSISTSNFCGPQFVGMWRDVAWHRRLTDIIHSAPVEEDVKGSLLAKRMDMF